MVMNWAKSNDRTVATSLVFGNFDVDLGLYGDDRKIDSVSVHIQRQEDF